MQILYWRYNFNALLSSFWLLNSFSEIWWWGSKVNMHVPFRNEISLILSIWPVTYLSVDYWALQNNIFSEKNESCLRYGYTEKYLDNNLTALLFSKMKIEACSLGPYAIFIYGLFTRITISDIKFSPVEQISNLMRKRLVALWYSFTTIMASMVVCSLQY